MPLPTYQEWWNSSTKFFGIRDELLKRIDHALQAFHAAAVGAAQRRIFLGDIFVYTLCWCRQNAQSSRLPAVFHLHGVASKEVFESFGAFSQHALNCLAKGDELPSTLTVRVRVLRTENVHRLIRPDLDRASDIWRQARVAITEWESDLGANEMANLLLPDHATLGNAGEAQLATYISAHPGAICCCYAPQITGADAAGKTERAGDHVGHLSDPMIKVSAELARPETFSHELGHALLNDGSHHFDPMNLMAVGAVRKGTELTPGQIALARGSKYAAY